MQKSLNKRIRYLFYNVLKLKYILLFLGTLYSSSNIYSQIEGEFQSNFSIYGLSSEYLFIQCDSTFIIERRNEQIINKSEGIWNFKSDTLYLFYQDSLNSFQKYFLCDTILKLQMPVFTDSIRGKIEEELGQELPRSDFRPTNMYGEEREYYLIKRKKYNCE
ncbi:hypothetical protein [Carboxylicivirga sp. RSCT41]|uniref:hypothetical protein n=1 Tax=Carboxylicivirga agarovorans TaxID=3417570 RepID=UPI003D352FED